MLFERISRAMGKSNKATDGIDDSIPSRITFTFDHEGLPLENLRKRPNQE